MKSIKEIMEILENEKVRSGWEKGVNTYAYELLEKLQENGYTEITEKNMLNGADNWWHYSRTGSGVSYIYCGDICNRLCTDKEKKMTRNGEREPSKRESWYDVQGRALYQACNKILELKNN